MPIHFTECNKPTLGVELEIQLLNPLSKNLFPVAPKIMEASKNYSQTTIKPELMESMIEINTQICNTILEVKTQLQTELNILHNIASAENTALAMSGTHPFQNWQESQIFNSQRYHDLLEKFQWLAKRWVTFGMHVHVGIRNGNRAIHVMNSITQFIPHLIALSASSPFWHGIDTGLESSRSAVMTSFPTGGLPFFLQDWKEFENYFGTLQKTNNIQSIKDIYWDVRPHYDFGTIEVRACDSIPNLKDTLAIVAFVHCLVVWLDEQFQSGKRSQKVDMHKYWLAPENKWQAVRYGLNGMNTNPITLVQRTIAEDIDRLLDELFPVAQTLDCTPELNDIKTILTHGNSAKRQREVFKQARSLESVVESLIKEFHT